MRTILYCMTMQHDWRLVVLAGLVCVGGLATTLNLLIRATLKRERRAATVHGAGAAATAALAIWATHFMAMTGYDAGPAVTYDLGLTLASLVIIFVATGLAVALILCVRSLAGRLLAGAVGFCGVAAMHFTGMAGLNVGSQIVWDPGLVAVALGTGLAFGMSAALVLHRWGRKAGAAAVGLVALSICSLHFLAMSAMSLSPMAVGVQQADALSQSALVVTVAGAVAFLILAATIAGLMTYWSRSSALNQIREAIEAMPDGLGFYDADDRLVLWNSRYAEVNPELASNLKVGLTFDDILRIGIKKNLYTEALGRPDEWVAERMAARREASNSLEQQIGDNRWLRVQDRRTAAGGVVTVVNDITDLKRDALALAEARDSAESANKAKSLFLANMSHEIRTPLNGVIGVAQALAATDLSPDQRQMLDLIQSSGHTLQTLLSDILDLARVESGRLELAHETFDLGKVISESAQLYAASAEAKGLQFFVEIAPEAQVWVEGDAVRLRQILTNLVSNAVKFTETGFISLTAGTGPERDGRSTLRFTIEDTGIGFDAACRERLFGRFEQADGGITRKFGGSGLGLAICRQLAEMMGGELDCESEPGGGSAFILTVPLVAVAAPVAEAGNDEGPGLGDVVPTLRVLLADDHPTNRKVVELVLAQAPVELTSVENGAEAVAAYRAGGFDLVLMDMQMPVMDGLTATREIRACEQSQGLERTPVVMLTANAMPEHIAAGIAAGADRHLAKPFNAADLLELVRQVGMRGPMALAA